MRLAKTVCTRVGGGRQFCNLTHTAAQTARLCPRDRDCGPGRIPDAARTARTPALVGRFEVVYSHAQVKGSEENAMDPERGVQPMKRPCPPISGH